MPINNLQSTSPVTPDITKSNQLSYSEHESQDEDDKTGSSRRIILSSLLSAMAISGWLVAGLMVVKNKKPPLDFPIENTVITTTDNTSVRDPEVQVRVKVVDSSILDTDGDGLLDRIEERLGTHIGDPDSDFDGFSDGVEFKNGFDPTGTGRPDIRVIVDRIGVNAPVILSESREEEDIQKHLQNGAIHYPGTSMPGNSGNIYITGHSSDFVWAKGEYKTLFSRLGEVEVNDIIKVVYTFNNGNQVDFIYQIYNIQVVAVDDPRLFQPEPSSVLTLVTSWPVGSTKERFMVKARLAN